MHWSVTLHRHSLRVTFCPRTGSLVVSRFPSTAPFTCLQIAAEAWFVARQVVAPGVLGMAYESAVWTPGREALLKQLSRQTGLTLGTVRDIVRYLTFGEVGVRNPDAAIQPIVDLGNGHFGISPFLLTHINAERNLCVLLNQVPADRTLYSALVDDKEHQLRTETIQSLQPLGFDFKHGGSVQQTSISQ
jgi:hypothetical protein